MSGLFGYFGGAAAPAEIARAMGARMCHTARQRAESDVVGGGAVGRVSIGLLNPESQPVCTPDGVCRLWFCGELYHQDRLRTELGHEGLLERESGDADLALAQYMHAGAAGLSRLEGAFVVAVWDGRTNELTIVNDRYGLYPHYYCQWGEAFAFAPEIKGMLVAPEFPRRVDLTAIAEYTRFQQLLGERTWLEDVHLLPPATIMRFSSRSGRLEMARYWDWDAIQPAPPMTFAEAASETGRLFQRAIDAMTKPPLRLGVYLSGGLDGRTILGFIPDETPVTAITYGQEGCRDVLYGRALARQAGRPHRWFPFADGRWVLEYEELHFALTEGMHGWMHAHGMSTLDEASTLIDVNLSGWDGGTILGGRLDEYVTDVDLRHAPSDSALMQRNYEAFCRIFTWPGLTEDEADALFSPPGLPKLRGLSHDSFAKVFARTAHYPEPYRADYFYIAQHVRRSTQSMIVFQRSATEVRCPFFDYSFVQFIYSLPEQILAGPALHRAVLTQRAPGMARVPYEKDDLLPHSNRLVRGSHAAVQRAKRGADRVTSGLGRQLFPERPRLYADYEHYLRTDLRAWAEDILFDERTMARGLYDPATVRALWERHLRGAELWTIGKIAPLITIEKVLRALVDDAHAQSQTEGDRALAH